MLSSFAKSGKPMAKSKKSVSLPFQTKSNMLHINSPEETISASPDKVYQMLTRFFERPLENIPGLSNWESFPDGCRFTVYDHITCRLTLKEQQPNTHVAYHAEVESPHVTATAGFDIVPKGSESILQAKMDADVPFFLQGMIKGVVNQFMGTAMQYLKKAIENS